MKKHGTGCCAAAATLFLIMSASASGEQAAWSCDSNVYGGSFPLLVDVESSKIEGEKGKTEDKALSVRWQLSQNEMMLTTLDFPTGCFAISSSVRGLVNKGRCQAPGRPFWERLRVSACDDAMSHHTRLSAEAFAVKNGTTTEAQAPVVLDKPTRAPTTATQAPVNKPVETKNTVAPETDLRLIELQNNFRKLLEQARARKITYLKAARIYRERFNELFPEQVSNDLMNEYLAYMATVGERIDKKKLTEAEGEYELARKMSELRDRALTRDAARQQEAARNANSEAARAELEQRRIVQEREISERRAAQERELALRESELAQQREQAAQVAEQAEKDRKAQQARDMMMTGLQLLLAPRPQPALAPPVTCRWVGYNWVCM